MNCQQAQEYFADYLENELAPPALADLESHLQACPACRAELESLQAVICKLDALDPKLSIPTMEEAATFPNPHRRVSVGRILLRTAAVLAIGFLLGRLTSPPLSSTSNNQQAIDAHSLQATDPHLPPTDTDILQPPGDEPPGKIHHDWIHLANAIR